MSLEDSKVYKAYKKHEKFFFFIEGLVIIALLITVNIYAYNDSQIKEEINKNCGWGEQDYECYCKRDEALALKNAWELQQQGKDFEINLSEPTITTQKGKGGVIVSGVRVEANGEIITEI